MDLTVAVLTGQRPALLDRTLTSFLTHHRDIWDQAAKVVVHNTADPDSAQILDRYDWDRRVDHHGPLLPIGQATALLDDEIRHTGSRYTLRLEDDWEAHPVDWWDDAVALLGEVGQVRLRRADETVSSRCLVCRKQTRWAGRPHRVGHTHYTYNPSLILTDLHLSIAGHANERDAMRRFHPRDVAQHQPGVFSHIGDHSLRTTEGAA